MKPAVVRPVVVLALVAAAWAQAPAATAAKRGPAAKPNASAGVNFTKDGRTEVFSSTETDLATGEVSVFEVVRSSTTWACWSTSGGATRSTGTSSARRRGRSPTARLTA